jgi:hypothetical protein
VTSIREFDIGVVSGSHPDIPRLRYIRIDLLLENLSRLPSIEFHVFHDLAALAIFLVMKHHHLYLLAGIVVPYVLCHTVKGAHVEVRLF